MQRGKLPVFMLAFGIGVCCPGVGSAQVPFAGDRGGPQPVKAIAFDGQRAMKYLRQICAIGPRISGSKQMRQQQELLKRHFALLGFQVRLQPFNAQQRSQKAPVGMANLIASWRPELPRRVILCCHYDTRPIADQERDPRNWRKPFLSANDGGSGVAFLMEFGHHMKNLPLKVGVDFVFFDGEEYIFDPDRDRYFFGSRHFAEQWRKQGRRPQYVAAILLDMIAGKNPRFPAEGYSYYRARPLLLQLWQIAAQQRCMAFQMRVGDHVRDDHLALQQVGIPAIDIIDFSYPHWHKLSDTPENCSPDGMIQVARVLSIWLPLVR